MHSLQNDRLHSMNWSWMFEQWPCAACHHLPRTHARTAITFFLPHLVSAKTDWQGTFCKPDEVVKPEEGNLLAAVIMKEMQAFWWCGVTRRLDSSVKCQGDVDAGATSSLSGHGINGGRILTVVWKEAGWTLPLLAPVNALVHESTCCVSSVWVWKQLLCIFT